jgi:FAD/FMN-containing dehydrogenase
VTEALIGRLRHVLGSAGMVSDPDEMAGYLTDWRNAYAGTAAAVVRPGCTEEVRRGRRTVP